MRLKYRSDDLNDFVTLDNFKMEVHDFQWKNFFQIIIKYQNKKIIEENLPELHPLYEEIENMKLFRKWVMERIIYWECLLPSLKNSISDEDY